MWEVKCVRYYGDETQYDGRWGLRGREQEALEDAVNQLCQAEGWEPFAYSDGMVSMWIRRQVPDRSPTQAQ